MELTIVDEIVLDVFSLDVCGLMLGSPYSYDNKTIIYKRVNKYWIIKNGKSFNLCDYWGTYQLEQVPKSTWEMERTKVEQVSPN